MPQPWLTAAGTSAAVLLGDLFRLRAQAASLFMLMLCLWRSSFADPMMDKLIAWKRRAGGREALLVEGARRVGKSTIVEEFGRAQYKSYILIDPANTIRHSSGWKTPAW